MTTTDKNRIIAAIENCCLTSEHRAQVVELFELVCAKEELHDIENEEWNPYTDACYAAQDEQDKTSEDREYAQMQAVAGWHHIPEIAPSMKRAAVVMSAN